MEAKDKIVVRGELALVLAVLINSFAVAVTVYAGAGHFAGVQLPVCGVAGVPVFDAGHLDVPVPGQCWSLR